MFFNFPRQPVDVFHQHLDDRGSAYVAALQLLQTNGYIRS